MKRGELVISREELGKLLEYSCSMPTGVTIGKRWRLDLNAYREDRIGIPPEWVIGEFVDIGSATEVGIKWYYPVDAPGQPIRGKL